MSTDEKLDKIIALLENHERRFVQIDQNFQLMLSETSVIKDVFRNLNPRFDYLNDELRRDHILIKDRLERLEKAK